jgi:hypothetical protein
VSLFSYCYCLLCEFVFSLHIILFLQHWLDPLKTVYKQLKGKLTSVVFYNYFLNLTNGGLDQSNFVFLFCFVLFVCFLFFHIRLGFI